MSSPREAKIWSFRALERGFALIASMRTCRGITPWAVNAKFSASYTTPRIFDSPLLEDFTTAVVVNARPLTTLAANWQIRNTYIRDSSTLGRLPTGALANGTTTKEPREDWSPAKHSLTAFFKPGRLAAGQELRIIEHNGPHVIDLLDELGF
jgi:hypothetical protein